MRYLILISFLVTILFSRENPFDSPFDRPKIKQDDIPLLSIKTHKIFYSTKAPKYIEVNSTKEKNSTIKKTVISSIKKEKKKRLLTPIIIDDLNDTQLDCIPICEVKPTKVKKEKKKKRKKKKKNLKFRTLFKNYFLTAKSNNKIIKLYTKDKLICSKNYTNPKRVFFDFKRLQYFDTKIVNLSNKYIKKIKFGSHHKFYRITIQSNKNYKIKKTKYGYLIYL